VRARLENVEIAARALRGDQRLEIRIEQRRPQLLDLLEKRAFRAEPGYSTPDLGEAGGLELVERESGKELLGGRVVMVAAIGPEHFCEVEDLRVARRVDAFGVAGDGFENPFLTQPEARGLVVDNRIDGDGGLAEPVSEGLLPGREFAEAFRF